MLPGERVAGMSRGLDQGKQGGAQRIVGRDPEVRLRHGRHLAGPAQEIGERRGLRIGLRQHGATQPAADRVDLLDQSQRERGACVVVLRVEPGRLSGQRGPRRLVFAPLPIPRLHRRARK